ncbi:MAG: hypothetical protein ABL921_23545 [Pirellula sp.]
MESGNQLSVLELLVRHDVPCVVIGGYAVTFHGYVRATEDVDLVFLRSAENEDRLFEALRTINACWISDEIDPQTSIEKLVPITIGYVRASRLMMLLTDAGFVDIFDYVPGCPDVNPIELWQTSISHELGIRFASLTNLRKMKIAAGRLKDRLDLEMLPRQED